MALSICPSCGGNNVEIFFKIPNAPIFSLVTVKSLQDALQVPKKRIDLGICNSCGFIYNTSFDKSIDYFTSGYEDQQGFSKTFMTFLTSMSDKFLNNYGLHGKTGLEIGCGKGDFNLISEISKGQGIGIDPAYEHGRQKNPKLTFIKDFYKKEHGNLEFDFIICRHTLEHIHDPNEFMRTISESLNEKNDVIILFEIPQVKRILDIQAFWDIYYEHCSYFTPATLANLFRKNGFQVLDLHLAYDDQYIVIEAKKNLKSTIDTSKFEIEESLNTLKDSVETFKRKVNEQLNNWREILTELRLNNKKSVIWGGGSKAVGFLTQFADLELFEYAVDINPHMKGNFIPGIGIQYVDPMFLNHYKPDVVIIMNGIYKNEIQKTLNDMGLDPEIFAL